MIYKVDQNFIVRTPIKSYNFYLRFLHCYTPKDLKEVASNEFREGLLVSSIDFYNSIFHSNKLTDTQIESLLKYLIRSSTRTTPFGISASIMKGKFSNEKQETEISLFKKVVKPDIEWLRNVVLLLEKELGEKLLVTKNSHFSTKKNRIIKKWNTYFDESISSSKKVTSIKYTYPLKKIFDFLDDYKSIEEISIFLKYKYPKIKGKTIHAFLSTLIDNEVLVSNLRLPLVHNNLFSRLISTYKNYSVSSKTLENLLKIETSIRNYQAIPIEEGINEYEDLIELMSNLAKSKSYLCLDTYNTGEVILKNNIRRQVEEFADFLSHWSFSYTYDEYINKFKEKYGNNAVKFIDVIDENYGIGKPIHDKSNKLEYDESIRSTLFENAINKNQNLLDLSDIKKIYNKAVSPYSGELSFYIFNDHNKYSLMLSPLKGTDENGKALGRFNHIFEFSNPQKAGFENIEVTFLPQTSQDGNVFGSFDSKTKYIEFGTSNKNLNTLSIDDIYMCVVGDKLRFIDKNNKNFLHFKASNLYKLGKYPEEIKILLETTKNQEGSLLTLIKYLEYMINLTEYHTPRIIYRDIILFPESWKLMGVLSDFGTSIIKKDEFYLKINVAIRKGLIPSIILSGIEDQQLLLNLENKECLSILYKMYKNDRNILIRENLTTIQNLILENQNQEKFQGEFIFEVSTNINNTIKSISKLPSHIDLIDRTTIDRTLKIPFDDWLCIHIYLEEYDHEELLINEFKLMVTDLQNTKGFNQLFFLRYMDSQPHLRIRINFNSKENLAINSIVQRYIKFSKQCQEKYSINDIQIRSYFPETERYGGRDLIEAAEEWFQEDSLTTIDLLTLNKSNTIDYTIQEIFLFSSLDLMNSLNITLNEQINILERYKQSKKFDKEYKNIFDNFLKKFECNNNQSNRLNNVFNQRRQYIVNYRDKFKDLSTEKKHSIIISILHMHHNRLCGINRNQEEKLLSIVYKYLYTIKNVKINQPNE